MSTNGQGSWVRSKYDSCNYSYDVAQQTGMNRYHLDPISTKNCEECRGVAPGVLGNRGVSTYQDISLVDVDAELKNITRRYSKCPDNKYKPKCHFCGMSLQDSTMKSCEECMGKLRHVKPCHIFPDDTRLVNPPCTLRGTGWSQHVFEDLCLNPQDPERIFNPAEVGINYRLVVKDNHKPCIPRPLDQTAVLPPQRENNTCVPMANGICGVPIFAPARR